MEFLQGESYGLVLLDIVPEGEVRERQSQSWGVFIAFRDSWALIGGIV